MSSLLPELAAIVLSAALGLGLTKPFFSRSSGAAVLLWASLGWGVGAGISSIIWFLFCMAPNLRPFYAELVEIATVTALWWPHSWIPSRRALVPLALQANAREPISGPDFRATCRLTRVTLALGVACLVLAILYGLMYTAVARDGDWDAWAIWNLHARILFRAPHSWQKQLFPISYSHPDYPLLLPISIARLWAFAGREDAAAPILMSFLFGFSPILVVVSALTVLKSWTHSAIAFVFLLGTSSLVHLAISQYADPVMSLYVACTFVFLISSRVFNQAALLYLAGLTAGLAAWVKNEGVLFVLAIGVVGLLAFRQIGRSRLVEVAKPFAIGLLFPAICLAIFKRQVPISSDVMNSFSRWSQWSGAFRWKPVSLVLKYYANQWWRVDRWTIPPLLWLAILIDMAGPEKDRLLVRNAMRGFAVMATMFVGYTIIYVTSPIDFLKWYLDSSLYRLILQLWPAFVFLTFLLVRVPILEPNRSGRDMKKEVSLRSGTVRADG